MNLRFAIYMLEAVRRSPDWIYLRREGKVILRGVPVMDNTADSFQDGLVRIVKNGKYGIANRGGHPTFANIISPTLNLHSDSGELLNPYQVTRRGDQTGGVYS
jgi:hypothetical protein